MAKSSFWPSVKALRWWKPSPEFDTPTNTCKICFKSFYFQGWTSLWSYRKTMCYRCYCTLEVLDKTWIIDGVPTHVIYRYNDAFRSLLFQLKGQGDYELKSVFLEMMLPELSWRHRHRWLVPAPSFQGDAKRRGFEHIESAFESLKRPFLKCLEKTYAFKQSSLSLAERQKIGDKLRLVSTDGIAGKDLLLVDDVLTSGSTLKAMIALIQPLRPRSLRALILSKKEGSFPL